ncbi:two-component sensor histidine kinase BarA [Parasalinivibrio latis]|uniref:two-component sensor histidine kinase BarA n=1 Tax=Parasalinivibrio latis TaxID=2952610 RepID=UPI0030E120E9
MTKYGLRARVVILTITPTLIIGLLLSAFFTKNRYDDLEDQIALSGAAIIEPLALSLEYGLTNESRENVRRLIGFAHRQHSKYVRGIAVFDDNNKLFATSNYHRNLAMLAIPDGILPPDILDVTQDKDSLILRMPIKAIGRFNSSLSNEENLGYVAMEMDLTSVQLHQYQELMTAFLVVLTGVFLSALAAGRLVKDVTRPISNMVSMVDRIRRGHLGSRIEGQMLGELDTLKNGINAMAVSLSEYHSEMQQSIDQATSDLRETLEQLEIQNVELDIAKKDAQEAARIKSEFLANMSHELRTPLNGVIGFTRQMLKTRLTPSQRDYLQTIEKSANNLLTIINDILDFSKLEAGKLMLENIPFDFQDTVDEVMRLLAPMAHEKGLELNLRVDNRIPSGVIGDPLRIQQVLTNLIGNASKFTERGQIDVEASLKLDREDVVEVQFKVRDTGIGISERQQSQLFQAFRQADASISRRYGGTGLGLVITQKLVKQMGGEIGLRSRLHQGSTFWFTLTLVKTDLPVSHPINIDALTGRSMLLVEPNDYAAASMRSRMTEFGIAFEHASVLPDDVTRFDTVLYSVPAGNVPDVNILLDVAYKAEQFSDKVIFSLPTTELALSERLLSHGVYACISKPVTYRKLTDLMTEGQELTYLPEQETPVLHHKLPLTVMAVDDNPANLKLIETLLKERVDTVVTAEHGGIAVEKARQQKFDIILMDIQMPEMDGVSACQAIRGIELNRATPVIAVTAHAMAGERERLLDAGMDDYLTKPIEEPILEQVLNKWTRAAGQIPEANEPAPQVSPISLSGNSLDWQMALKQAAGKEDLAQEMLQMLVDSFPAVEKAVQGALDGKDVELWQVIHKLHGSCAYSGVPVLRQLCYTLESSLKNGSNISDLEPELLELLDEIEHIKTAALSHLS